MTRRHQQFKMAADKPEAVHIVYSGCHIELHIDFDEITGQSILHCDGDPWQGGSSIWNHVSTCYLSKVIITSGFAAAILIYVHDYTKRWSHFNPNGSTRLDYVEIDRKIVVIFAANPEIQTFQFFRLFGRHLGFAAERHGLQNCRHHHKKFDPENMGVAAGISFLSALELEIPLGVNYPPDRFSQRSSVTAGDIWMRFRDFS